MNTQNKVINIRIDDNLKKEFKLKCENNHMKMSNRIKYLMKLDVDGKLKIKL